MSWMVHDPRPCDPYAVNKVTAAAENYDPTTGQPVRRFARQGYYYDLDWTAPKAKKTDEPTVHVQDARKKKTITDPKIHGPSERAKPGDTAAVFGGGMASSLHINRGAADIKGTVVGKIYKRGQDDVWVPVSKQTDNTAAEQSKRELQEEIRKASQVRKVKKEQIQKEKEADRLLIEKNPFANSTPMRVEKKNPPIEALDRHHARGMANIEGFSPVKGTEQAPPKKEIKKNFQPDVLGGVRYDHDFPREEKRKRMENYQKQLDAMVQEREAEALAKQERDLKQTDKLDKFLDQFGKDKGTNAGDKTNHRKVRTFNRVDRRVDRELANALKHQIYEKEEKRLNARNDTVELSDTFTEHPRPKRSPRRIAHTKDGIMLGDENSSVEGVSLAYGMSRTSPYRSRREKRAKDFLKAEQQKEDEAQKSGDSRFGKAGSGAPLRDSQGRLVAAKPVVSQGFETMEEYLEARQEDRQKKSNSYTEQTEFAKEAEERRRRNEEEEKRAAAEAARFRMLKPKTGKADNGKQHSKNKKLIQEQKSYKLTEKAREELMQQMEQNQVRKALEKEKKQSERRGSGLEARLGRVKIDPDASHAKRAPDVHYHPEEVSKRPILQMSAEEKTSMRVELDSMVAEKQKLRQANKIKRLQQDQEHSRNANKFVGKPSAGVPRRDPDGIVNPRRDIGDGEHRGLVPKVGHLV